MKSEKMSIRNWVSSFYFIRAMRGSEQAMYYSERTLAVVILVQLVLFAGLMFVQIKIYPEGNWFLGAACYLIVSYFLYNYGRNLNKKRFSQLAPSSIEMEAKIEEAMNEIVLLNEEELTTLQDLVDSRSDKDLFLRKLEEALHFGKLAELDFLKEVADIVGKNHRE